MNTTYRAMLAVCSLAMLACSTGCVFREIRDEVRTSNTQIAQVESQIESTRGAIDDTNRKLASVDEGLARLDATNLSLSDVQERLALLRSIEVSLSKVDHHLASLRKTIGQIDSMIPFVDLGGDAPVESAETPAEPAPEVTAAPADAPVSAAPADAAAAAAAPAKRDALLGAWVSEFPDRGTALIIIEGGRYTRQSIEAGGKRSTETGGWARDRSMLTLTPDLPPAPPRPQSTPGNAATAPPPPAPMAYEIVTRSTRSMTLRAPDGGLLILSKP